MDKATAGAEKEVKLNNTSVINIPVLKDREALLDDLMKVMEESKKRGLDLLAKYDQSMFISNKKFIPYFINLINLTYEALRESIIASCALEYLEKKTELLEELIAILAERTDKTDKNWKEIHA